MLIETERLRIRPWRDADGESFAVLNADPQKNAGSCHEFNYGSENASAPDLCWVRKPNTKSGMGLFGEQYIAHDIGVFGRAMVSNLA